MEVQIQTGNKSPDDDIKLSVIHSVLMPAKRHIPPLRESAIGRKRWTELTASHRDDTAALDTLVCQQYVDDFYVGSRLMSRTKVYRVSRGSCNNVPRCLERTILQLGQHA